jgi:uncharacterized protein
MRHLLDVNVLIALLDAAHPAAGVAHQWFVSSNKKIATCPIVLNGALRIMTQPSYGDTPKPLVFATVMRSYENSVKQLDHEFWSDSLSLADHSQFDHSKIYGPKQLTDIYLLGLATANAGCLVTLDRGITIAPVKRARAKNLVQL